MLRKLTMAVLAGVALVVGVAGVYGQDAPRDEAARERALILFESRNPPQEPEEGVDITVDGIGVTADEVHFNSSTGVLEAVGNVNLTVPAPVSGASTTSWADLPTYMHGRSASGTIRADRAVIDREDRVIEAQGNVQVTIREADSLTFEASEMTIRYRGPLTGLVEVQ